MDSSAEDEDQPTDDDHWVPFLQPRKKRPRVAPQSESDDNSSDDEEEVQKEFPYPLKTRIARDFGDDGIFWGTIVKHYPDDSSLCQVCYTDGDKEDLDADEVAYAIDLYRKHFIDHE